MSFSLLILTEGINDLGDESLIDEWPSKLKALIPGIEVHLIDNVKDAEPIIEHVDAAFGYIGPNLFGKATNLKWIQGPQAGPKAGFYHKPMMDSEVIVTNVRGIFNDHISTHIMSYVLAFSRSLNIYISGQTNREWKSAQPTRHLPECTALIVGVGGIGSETAKQCTSFGMTVLGIDARMKTPPAGVKELHRPESLNNLLPQADFVIVTVPETPSTQGLFTKKEFQLMKSSSYFINIGRGATVSLDHLTDALNHGEISGAALDVFEIEPLPNNHPLWSMPNVIITPHIAGSGPYLDQRREELFLDNCLRFSQGKMLRNIVDKKNWF